MLPCRQQICRIELLIQCLRSDLENPINIFQISQTFELQNHDFANRFISKVELINIITLKMKKAQSQEYDRQTLRMTKMNSLRRSLKEIPLLSQKRSRIQKQLKLKKVNTRTQSECSPEDVDSLSGRLSVDDDLFNYDSFLEKYELLDKIGEGGNGCVFKCQHKLNQKYYAAKKFKAEQEHIAQLKKSFIIMKNLNHQSICHYKALYFDNKKRVVYLVMEYLPFKSLSDSNIGSEAELRSIVRELLEAILYLHNKNICHRDIKPQNILYNKEEKKIKIIDFGISKKTFLRGARRDMLTIIGTHFYLAPEVFIGGGYDQRIDLWALGVTIYKLITGYTPFESVYHSDTIDNILKGEVTFDEDVWERYHWFAKDFVTRLLKGKDQRMTIHEAMNHLWLQAPESTKRKPGRLVSHNIQLSEDFRHQMRYNSNAASKQEGSKQNDKNKKLFKSINLITELQYDLQDSDEEEVKVTRSMKIVRPFVIKPIHSLENFQGEQTDII